MDVRERRSLSLSRVNAPEPSAYAGHRECRVTSPQLRHLSHSVSFTFLNPSFADAPSSFEVTGLSVFAFRYSRFVWRTLPRTSRFPRMRFSQKQCPSGTICLRERFSQTFGNVSVQRRPFFENTSIHSNVERKRKKKRLCTRECFQNMSIDTKRVTKYLSLRERFRKDDTEHHACECRKFGICSSCSYVGWQLGGGQAPYIE